MSLSWFWIVVCYIYYTAIFLKRVVICVVITFTATRIVAFNLQMLNTLSRWYSTLQWSKCVVVPPAMSPLFMQSTKSELNLITLNDFDVLSDKHPYSLRSVLNLRPRRVSLEIDYDVLLLLVAGLRPVKDVLYLVPQVTAWHRRDPHIHMVLCGVVLQRTRPSGLILWHISILISLV